MIVNRKKYATLSYRLLFERLCYGSIFENHAFRKCWRDLEMNDFFTVNELATYLSIDFLIMLASMIPVKSSGFEPGVNIAFSVP